VTPIFAVTFVMSAVLICKWTLSHYDDDDDDDDDDLTKQLNICTVYGSAFNKLHRSVMLAFLAVHEG